MRSFVTAGGFLRIWPRNVRFPRGPLLARHTTSRGFLLVAAITVCACASARQPDVTRTQDVRSADHPTGHILITTETLDSECYRDLGEVEYAQPFYQAAIDPDHTELAQQLRGVAQEKYPNQVDAVIGMHASANEVGTAIVASGEAVQFEHQGELSCAVPRTMRATVIGLDLGSSGHPVHREPGAAGTETGAQGAGAAGMAGSHGTMGAKQILQRALKAKMLGQTGVSEQTLFDQMQAQQAEIEGLRKQFDGLVHRRCEEQDISASQCASAEKAALPDEAPPALIGTTNSSGDEALTKVAIENRIQAQQETISGLRRAIADMKGVPEKPDVTPSSAQSAAPESRD